MDKYFTLIQLKKQKIQKSENVIKILNDRIKLLNEEINDLSSEYCNEIIALEEITMNQKERDIKDNTNLISLIILIASLIIGYFLFNKGVSLLNILLIGGITNMINLLINRIIIRATTELYGFIREFSSKEIEYKNKKLQEIQKKTMKIGKQKSQLYEQKNKLYDEINKETRILHEFMDKIIEEYSVLLDELIVQDIENNSNPEHELEIKRLRELIEKNTKSV